MLCSDLLSFWSLQRLSLASDEGFRFGRADKTVSGIQLCWMPTLDAIEAAAQSRCNLMVVHEELNFPPVYAGASLEDSLCGVTYQRMQKLLQYDITLFRAHSSLDTLCILDVFGSLLGLGNPEIYGGYSQRVYDFPPVAFDALCRSVQERTGLPYLRVCGNPEQVVSRAALLWGGVGISANSYTLQDALQHGADVIIAGEAEEIPMLAAADAGVCYVETGHSHSENPGLQRVQSMLAAQFQEVPVLYYENRRPWRLVGREAET